MITDVLVEKKVIERDESPIYQFGLELIFLNTVNLLTFIVLGLIFKEIRSGFIFLIAIICLRKYAGGFHASTRLHCYILTSAVCGSVIIAIKYFPLNFLQELCATFFSTIILFWLAPVSSENKPLEDSERIQYRKRSIAIFALESCFFFVFYALQLRKMADGIIWAQMVTALSMGIEKAKQRRRSLIT